MIKVSIKNSREHNLVWKPEIGEQYFYILVDGGIDILQDVWSDEPYHEDAYKIGNCFRTMEDAEKAKSRIEDALMPVFNEHKNIPHNPHLSVDIIE